MDSSINLFESSTEQGGSRVRIAFEGCGHGTLNNIYSSVAAACQAKSWPGIDLLIIGGDFQAVRNSYDLNAMAVPAKYREIGDFHEYYSGKRSAPYLTIFIGGNHEASNHLTELYYGGWVAPKIYYMGAANVLKFGPLRIAGMSGIWKGYHYRKSHYERLPYGEDDKKSVYHVRELDVRKLLQIRTQVDIGLSHDWPEGIQWCGDWQKLFRNKQFLEPDARSGRLGNVAAKYVLQRLRPRYWFSAHLHTKFTAVVKHSSGGLDAISSEGQKTNGLTNDAETEIGLEDLDAEAKLSDNEESTEPVANSDEIQLDLEDLSDDNPMQATNPKTLGSEKSNQITDNIQHSAAALASSTVPPGLRSNGVEVSEELRAQLPDSFKRPPPPENLPFPEDIQNDQTRFLALDKCLPNREFLQLVEIPSTIQSSSTNRSRSLKLEYDKEWLAISRVFAKDLEFGNPNAHVPRDEGEAVYRKRIVEEEEWVEQNIVAKDKMTIPEDFELTAPVYDPSIGIQTRERPTEVVNPQTVRYCSLLQIDNPLEMSEEEKVRRHAESIRFQSEQPARGGYGSNRGHSRGGRNRGGRGRGRGR